MSEEPLEIHCPRPHTMKLKGEASMHGRRACRQMLVAMLAATFAGIGQAGEGSPPAPRGLTQVTFVDPGGSRRTCRVAPGEWVPHGIYRATLYIPSRLKRQLERLREADF